MPVIHIRSLPFNPPLNTPGVLEAVTQQFAKEAGVRLKYVSACWSYLEPGHYVDAGQARGEQAAASHPLLVELLTPDVHQPASIEKQLTCLALALSRHTGISLHNIFIQHREARSGQVFDQGDIVRW